MRIVTFNILYGKGRDGRALVEDHARYFLRQTLSTPRLGAVAKAAGISIEDVSGLRFMDFHGDNTHHVGYWRPHLVAAM